MQDIFNNIGILIILEYFMVRMIGLYTVNAEIFAQYIIMFAHFAHCLRDWSLITGGSTGRGGATKGENRGSEIVCAPPPPKTR